MYGALCFFQGPMLMDTRHHTNTQLSHRALLTMSVSLFIAYSGTVASAQFDHTLRLKSQAVDVQALPNAKVANNARPQRFPDRMVIVLDRVMTPDLRTAIESTGTKLEDYLPDRAYVVNLRNARLDALRNLDFVTHIVEYKDAWKIDPSIGKRSLQTESRKALAASGKVAAQVYLFPGEQINTALKAIQAQPGIDVVYNELVSDRFMIEVVGSSAQVRSLSKIAAVQWIESAPEITMRNSTDRWIVQSNINGDFPVYDAGIHGENQLVAVMDGRVRIDHCSFVDPEGDPIGDNHRKIQAYNTSTSNPDFHGTHVAGTVLGDNGVNDDTRGVAYNARLIFNTTPAFSFAAMNSRLSEHYSQGASIHTNSWGDDGTTDYTGLARSIDTFSHENDDNLIIFAATNLNSLKSPENAKNCLAVGASQDASSQDSFCSGGIGPTDDGRRKPEIFAPGCNTRSANSQSSCGTTGLTGTSMAAPAIAGAAALTRQYFEDGFYPSGLAESQDGFVPSGTLLKATLLNSAVDMTNIAGFPSNREGWGRVLLDNALYFNGDANKLIIDDIRNASNDALETGDEYELHFTVNSLTQPLKATLVWHDAPASPASSFTPVNNLDLEIVLPTGQVLIGNNIANGVSAFGGTPDEINNVEMVMLPASIVGDYVLKVKATAINDGQQGFAIVITGDVTESTLGCSPADLAEPFGTLDFFDVSAFLSAFNAMDAAADFNNDGIYNFFDISAFLNAFNEGCP